MWQLACWGIKGEEKKICLLVVGVEAPANENSAYEHAPSARHVVTICNENVLTWQENKAAVCGLPRIHPSEKLKTPK